MSPIRTNKGSIEFSPHRVNIDLWMDKKLLDTEIEFKNEKGRNLRRIERGIEVVSERAKKDTFRRGRRNREFMMEKDGRRRNGGRRSKIIHGSAEENERSNIMNLGESGLSFEPDAEIDPIGGAILDGSGTKNPTKRGGFSDSPTSAPSLSSLAVADTVSFIKNNALKALSNELVDSVMCCMIRSDSNEGDITSSQFLSPSGD